MEVLLLLVLVVLLIVFIRKLNRMERLLDNQLNSIHDSLQALWNAQQRRPQETQARPPAPVPAPKPVPTPMPQEAPPVDLTPPEPEPATILTPALTPAKPEPTVTQKTPETRKPAEPAEPPIPQVPVFRESLLQRWMRSIPDFEKFVGEHLANKVGIGILVLGIGFFVKYAIDKDWINEAGRVAIGLGCGALLIALAHYLRQQYRSFSSVLVGGGLAVFYFTIALAYHEYRLLPQPTAFGIMVGITIFAVVLSLLYNRMELAILALLGGFAAPFMVSSGSNNYLALFTYLIILNTGMLTLAWFRRWPVLNTLALVFTVLIFGGWLTTEMLKPAPPLEEFRHALAFATVFYLLFVAMGIVNHLRRGTTFKAYDFVALLSINALYYAAGITCLMQWQQQDFKGLFTASLGVFNLLLTGIFMKRRQVDKHFLYLLIGLTLSYVSLAAPVQLEGNNITLFWSTEFVLLFWLYQRSQINLLKIFALGVSVLALLSLLMDWPIYGMPRDHLFPVMINKLFVTGLVSAAAWLAFHFLLRREESLTYWWILSSQGVSRFALVTGVAVLFMTGALETHYQTQNRIPLPGVAMLYLCLYCLGFAMAMIQWMRSPGSSNLHWRLALLFIGFLLFVSTSDTAFHVAIEMTGKGVFQAHFLAWWASAAIMLYLFANIMTFFRRHHALSHLPREFVVWVYMLSMVTVMVVVSAFAYSWLRVGATVTFWQAMDIFSRAGVTIALGCCSFALIWLGFRLREKTLRIIALSIFTLALVKLFFSDIRDISPGGKIAAFTMLGVLLLVVSFMYQRIRKIFKDNDQPTETA